MINNVVLIGRLTRDPELRYTPSNVAVATFTLAVNRNFKGVNGEREADFINCIMWRQQAENFANWCKKVLLWELQVASRLVAMIISKDNVSMLRKWSLRVFKRLKRKIIPQTNQAWEIRCHKVTDKVSQWIFQMMICHSENN